MIGVDGVAEIDAAVESTPAAAAAAAPSTPEVSAGVAGAAVR